MISLDSPHSVSSLNGKPTHHSSRSSNSSEPSLLHESKQGAQAEELLRNAEVCNMKEKVDEKVKENFQKPSIDFCSLSNHESESDVSERVVSPPSDVDKRGWVQSLIESARNLTQIPHSHTSSKDQQDNCLNRSEKDEEDLDLFKDHSQVEMPAGSVKSPQPNQPTSSYCPFRQLTWSQSRTESCRLEVPLCLRRRSDALLWALYLRELTAMKQAEG